MSTLLAALLALVLLAPSRSALDAEEADVWLDWVAARLLEGGAAGMYAPYAFEQERVVLFASRLRKTSKAKRAIAKTCRAFDELFSEREGVDVRTVVLFDLDNAEAMESLTSFAGAKFPQLAGWAASAAGGVGFVLEEPLAAAWLNDVPGADKGAWNPENELVHRLAQLLLVERHGRLPHWLSIGLAWYVELDVCGDIYCFPSRSGFVGKREHKGWGKQLAASLAARGERPLTAAELTAWPRGTYDDDRAALAWAAATLLAKYFPDELPAVLAALADVRDAEGRTTHPDGSWEPIAGYEIAAERQLAIMNAELGIDFLVELDRFARRGARSYSRPR